MMPRKKGGSDRSNSDQSPVHDLTSSGHQPFQYGNLPGYINVDLSHGGALDGMQSSQDQAFARLKELCDGKVDDEGMYNLLSQCGWKVEEAAEKIHQMSWSTETDPDSQNIQYLTQHATSEPKALKLNLRSRLPSHSTDDGSGSLTLLSPKTPNMMPEYSEMLHYSQNQSATPMQSAMEALDTFGGQTTGAYLDPNVPSDTFVGHFGPGDSSPLPSEGHGVGLTPVDSGPMAGTLFVQSGMNREMTGLSTIVEHQRPESLSPGGSGEAGSTGYLPGVGQSAPPVQTQLTIGGFPSSVGFGVNTQHGGSQGTDNKLSVSHPQKPRGSRKKTLSLNPEEREALENLIEDVIIGGIVDSDESSTSSESEEDAAGSEPEIPVEPSEASTDPAQKDAAGKETMPKIYPAQLKVAVKHMRNLPPRFMRRLENAQKKIDAAEKLEQDKLREEKMRAEGEAMQKERERMRFREDQKREKKKKIRNLLDDMDQYTDEQNIAENKDPDKRTEKPKGKGKIHKELKANHPAADVENIQESSQPIHVGLSKGQSAPKTQSHDITNELAQQLLEQQLGPVPVSPAMLQTNVVNCEDLERELLGEPISHMGTTVFSSMGMPLGQPPPQPIFAYPGMHNSCDFMDKPTLLSVDAPEFVPYNSFGMPSHPQFSVSQHIQGHNPHMQVHTTNPMVPVSNSPHLQAGSKHVHNTNFNSVSKESPVMSVDMMRTKSSSPFQAPLGRLSPQVVPVSSSPGPLIPQHPLPQTTLSNDQIAQNPPFLVPKMPPNIPPPPTSRGPSHTGVGMVAMHPYQMPYPYTGLPPPPQGYPFRQQFVPTHGFLPWSGDGAPDNHGQTPSLAHLVGMPLKASPQMGRKRGAVHHHGNRQPAPGARPGFILQNKPPPTDVKVMSGDISKKHVQQLLKDGKKVMVLLRGCPGSGKSKLAREMVFDGMILSTDDFFINGKGEYEYDIEKIGEAHVWNQSRAKQAVDTGINPIIIDNTNTQTWEMKTYVSMAMKNGYQVEIIEPDTPWRHNAKELAKRNTHAVSLEAIRRMLDRFDHNVTLQNILGTSAKKVEDKEKTQEPPAEGEQAGKKTPRRRKKKKRKRNRKKDKAPNTEESQQMEDAKQHSSEESSDEDAKTTKPSPPKMVPIERNPSLSNTEPETTSSPRDTTPEATDKFEDDPWQNSFPQIKEDPQCDDRHHPETTTDNVVDSNLEKTDGVTEKTERVTERTECVMDSTDVNSNRETPVDNLQGDHCGIDDSANNNDRDNTDVNILNVYKTALEDKMCENDNLKEPVQISNLSNQTEDAIESTNILHNTETQSSQEQPETDFASTTPDPANLAIEGLDIKGEVTRLLEDHIMKAMVKEELARVAGSHSLKDAQLVVQGKSHLMDIDTDSEDEAHHRATMADLQQSLEDIGFDNPTFEADLDIDLDHEYGLDSNSSEVVQQTHAAPGPETKSSLDSDLSLPSSPQKAVSSTDAESSYWSSKDTDAYTLSLSEENKSESDLKELVECQWKPIEDETGSSLWHDGTEEEPKPVEDILESPKPRRSRRDKKWKETKGDDKSNPWLEDELSSASCSSSSPQHNHQSSAVCSNSINKPSTVDDLKEHETGQTPGCDSGDDSPIKSTETTENTQQQVTVEDHVNQRDPEAEVIQATQSKNAENQLCESTTNSVTSEANDTTDSETNGDGSQKVSSQTDKAEITMTDNEKAELPVTPTASNSWCGSTGGDRFPFVIRHTINSDVEFIDLEEKPGNDDRSEASITDSGSESSKLNAQEDNKTALSISDATSKHIPQDLQKSLDTDQLSSVWKLAEIINSTVDQLSAQESVQSGQLKPNTGAPALVTQEPIDAITPAAPQDANQTPSQDTRPKETTSQTEAARPTTDTQAKSTTESELVKPEVREKLLNHNWNFPVPKKATSPCVPIPPAPVAKVKTCAASTQTNSKDYSFVQKLEHSELDAVLVMEEYNIQTILQAQNRPTILDANVQSTDECGQAAPGGTTKWNKKEKFHKGCQTEEHCEDNKMKGDLDAKVALLQVCFSGTSRVDLEHILEQCQGDVEWASNILLDGGAPGGDSQQPRVDDDPLPTSIFDSVQPEQVLPDSERTTESVASPSQEDTQTVTDMQSANDCSPPAVGSSDAEPPSLLVMCHNALVAHGTLGPEDDALEQVAEKSLQRLRSIEEFQHHHYSSGLLGNMDDQSEDEISNAASTLQMSVDSKNRCASPEKVPGKPLGTVNDLDKFCLPPPLSRQLQEPVLSQQRDRESGVNVIQSGGASEEGIKLVLTPHLAQILIQSFGPVNAPFAPVALSDNDLCIQLDKQTAQQIHKCWGDTLTSKLAVHTDTDDVAERKRLEEDEALAKQLQEEEYKLAKMNSRDNLSQPLSSVVGSPVKSSPSGPTKARSSSPAKIKSGEVAITVSRLSPTKREGSPSKRLSSRGSTNSRAVFSNSRSSQEVPPSLRDIMNEEMAIEASRKEYLDTQDDVKANEGTLSTKLKWQQLTDRFPGVDPQMLDDVFESTGYHLESTIHTIASTMDRHGPAKNVMTKEAADRFEEMMFKQAVQESLDQWPEDEEPPSSESLYQALEEPAYDDFRAEASMHYKLRQEAFEKATSAYQKGMKDVASFYSQQGHLHSEKLRAANHRAAMKIVEFKNVHLDRTNSLDLHGLHVDEALLTLEKILSNRETEQREKPDKRRSHLVVVTGRGTHSRGGIARIRPAVIDYLKTHNYRWSEPSPSMIKVQLRYKFI